MFNKTKSSLAITLSVAMLASMVVVPGVASAATATQLSGKDRYETALKIVEAGWMKSDSAVIARGDDLADALAAAPLAYAKGKAPILLTKTNEVPAGVLQELKDLGVKNLYIVGGVGAVSKAVETQLSIAGVTVTRISGMDRFETSLNIAKAAFTTAPADVVIANGLAYADALSVSSIAATKGMPILLVNNNKLSADQASYIAGKTAYAIGGEGVLNADVVSAAKATRVSGLDRYKTNAAVLAKFKPDYSKIYLAKGTPANLVDALAGSALAALTNSPIVLVDGNNKVDTDLQAIVKENIASDSAIITLGGTVSQVAVSAIEALKPTGVTLTSVMAVSAKSIKVTFSSAVDTTKAVIEVMRGTVKPSVKSVTFADDKKSAVIEFTTSLAAGDYTTTVTGLSVLPLIATTKVEAEKLTKINFTSDVAVLNRTTSASITTNVEALNQYGEAVTAKLTTAAISSSKGSAVISNTGVITATSTTPYTIGEKVVMTIVDATTGVVATKTLTVAQAADVKSIEFGAIKTDDVALVGKEINVTAMTTNAGKYYLPITVKNQYGSTLKAADILGSVNILTSNDNIIKIASTQIVDTTNGTVIKFTSAVGTPVSGTVVLTAVASATGITANTTVVVKDNAKLDVVTLAAPATELKLNTAVALPVTVVDSYGKEVALKDITLDTTTAGSITLNTNTKITAVNGTFTVVKDYVKDITTIKLTPTAKNVILTVTTATGKYQSLVLTASAAPVVSAIKGINAKFVTMLANDNTLLTRLDDQVEFVDQYGDDIDAPALGSTFTIEAKDLTNVVTDLSSTTPGAIVASATAGTETYVITLKDANGVVLDTKEETVTVVDSTKITAFGVDDLDKFYTNAAATSYTQDADIYGLVDTKKVVVNQNMAKSFTASNGLEGSLSATGVYTPKNAVTDAKDLSSVITVLVDNGVSTYTITKDAMYSDAAPKAASIAITLDTVDVTAATVQVKLADMSKLVIAAKDQYAKVMTTGYSFIITSNTTGANVTISNTGVLNVPNTAIVGESFQINAAINGVTKAIKVIIGQ